MRINEKGEREHLYANNKEHMEYVLNYQFMMAIIRSDLEIMKSMIRDGYDINEMKNSYNHGALHLAVMIRRLDVIEFVINNGADMNRKSVGGITPMHIATMPDAILRYSGFPTGPMRNPNALGWGTTSQVIELLHENGADINAKTVYNDTPLHFAVAGCSNEAKEKLMDLGADRYCKNVDGTLPLDMKPEVIDFEGNMKVGDGHEAKKESDESRNEPRRVVLAAENFNIRNSQITIIKGSPNASVNIDQSSKGKGRNLICAFFSFIIKKFFNLWSAAP